MKAELGSRSLFPTLKAKAYTNHAAISPPSTRVRRAVADVVEDYAQHGVDAFMRWHERRDEVRASCAGLINCTANDICFAANTTRGITDIALCIPWKRGDRVVVTRGEFPANVTPWQRAAELFELELSWLPQPTATTVHGEWLDALDQALHGARLVALSAVQFQTGLRMPLDIIGERCAAHRVELCVDAIQACGVVPVDVAKSRVHYLAAGSHKWLMGTEGIAMVYVEPEAAARLEPRVAGWLSHEDALTFLFEGPGHLRYDRDFDKTPRMLEGGMYNTIGCMALGASVSTLIELGIDTIFEHVDAYNDELDKRLAPLGLVPQRASEPALRSGIASYAVPPDIHLPTLHGLIEPTIVSCATPDGFLRLSPHWPNHRREIDIIHDTLERALDACPRTGAQGPT